MNYNRKVIVVLFLLIILIACVACNPTATPIPVPAAYPAQDSTRIHLEGNSITFNTYYSSVDHSWLAESSSFCGGTKIDSPGFCTSDPTPQQRVTDLLEQGEVGVLVWALGENEILHEGWSQRYQLLTYDLLFQKVPSTTCIVMVKGWTDARDTKRPRAQMEAWRTWIDQQAAAHPNVVTVDWKPLLEANPGWSNDGTHLIEQAAFEARDNMYREGVAQCN